MTVSKETEIKVGECHICEINVYDRGEKNKPFWYLGKQRMGCPRDVAMPCGLNRPQEDKYGNGRCPFETKEEQDDLNAKIKKIVFSGANNWDGIT